MAEHRPMVCYSRGVTDSVIHKLAEVRKTHPKVDPLLKDLESLRDDLLNKFAGGQATHNQVRAWIKQIRGLVYFIEDWIDLKLASKLEESETKFEEQIEEFRAKIEEARDRSERYNLLQKAPNSDANLLDAAPRKEVTDDSQLLVEKKGVLVGIDGPRKKLAEHLKGEQKKRMVVCVLGLGGLGKTTLATKVYEELNEQFECHASVTVGRNSSMAALMDVFHQVNPEMVGHDTRASLNQREVILQLWEFLKNKRYFILIDDIRDTHAWSVINCALPNNDLGSRILTTTHVKDVAMSCSVRPTNVVYQMKGLDEDDSRSLLLSTMPTLTENRSENFKKDCDDMLNKCGGFPLAIIVTAGLLAMKLADLGPLGKPEESGTMRNVLDVCFAGLAPPLKACFLYLSTFPENYTIKKDRVINRWVAEGFIPEIDQESMLETGESYFNELICRKLIQPVWDDCNDDQVVLCTVHSVIHDFISSLSRQEGFHTTGAELISGPFPYGTIRRFSIDCSRQESDEADTLKSSGVHLSRIRSLTVFGDAARLPDLSTFQHLRVLDLEDNKIFDNNQLEGIGSLFLLRYLGLGGTNVTKLPQNIMKLVHLSTLDLRRTSVMELPTVEESFITSELVSVVADGLILPREIGEMKQLEELYTVSLLPDDAARLVNKSRQLRMLGVTFGYVYILTRANQQGVKRFLEEVRKSNLHSLLLDDYPSDSVQLLECWANEGPNNLKKIELRMSDCFQVVPPKLKFLIALTHLHIRVRQVDEQGVNALGSLPNLVLLKLFSGEGTKERLTISSEHGFPRLKVFWFSSYFLGMGLQFKAGAMPQLQRLRMEFHARKTKFAEFNFDFGIEHLCHLLQVRAIILCKHATDSEAKTAEAAIRDQVSKIRVHGDGSPRNEATRGAGNISASVDIRISILPESSSPLPIAGPISFVMDDAMVSYSTGAMNSVLTKLATLMGERYAELTSTDENEMMTLRNELLVMNALLKQLSETADLNKEMVECRDQMWELTYDIDDSIDDLMLRSVNEDDSSGTTEKRVVMLLRDFTVQIRELNGQVEKAELRSTVRKTGKLTFESREMSREQWLSEFYYDERDKPVERVLLNKEYLEEVFADLSSDMKTCLLYLSIFPANHEIEKDRLIRLWAAEGFLPKRSVEGWFETGECYFFELIARKLIEPIYDEMKNRSSQFYLPNNEENSALLPTGCQMCDDVHDFIKSRLSEENFVKSGKQQVVFWQLVHYKDKVKDLFKEPKCSKVRSVIYIETVWWPHLDFSGFIHVRVLDLHGVTVEEKDLRWVGCLSLLKYLGLVQTPIRSLPEEITTLEHLETVDLRSNRLLKEFPAFKSRKLVSLIADSITLPTNGMGEMQVLEELSTVVIRDDDHSHRLAEVVDQSKRLRRLGVTIPLPLILSERKRTENGMMDLWGAIAKSNIESLRISAVEGPLLNLLVDCWANQRPRHLQKLELATVGTEVPRNITTSLIDLTHLSIGVDKADTQGVSILGNLPNLIVLSLNLWSMEERSIIISKNGFRCLRVFKCSVREMVLQFEAGAMPQLRSLWFSFHPKKTYSNFGGVDFGIQFLTRLVQVHATIDCCAMKKADVEALEDAMRDQVHQNPNNPVLTITRYREHRMVRDTVTDKRDTSKIEDSGDEDRKSPYGVYI